MPIILERPAGGAWVGPRDGRHDQQPDRAAGCRTRGLKAGQQLRRQQLALRARRSIPPVTHLAHTRRRCRARTRGSAGRAGTDIHHADSGSSRFAESVGRRRTGIASGARPRADRRRASGVTMAERRREAAQTRRHRRQQQQAEGQPNRRPSAAHRRPRRAIRGNGCTPTCSR